MRPLSICAAAITLVAGGGCSFDATGYGGGGTGADEVVFADAALRPADDAARPTRAADAASAPAGADAGPFSADAAPQPRDASLPPLPVDADLPAVALTVDLALSPLAGGRVTSLPGGIDCGPTCAADYPLGTVVTLTADPALLSRFTHWSGDCTGTSTTCAVALDGDASVTAHFRLL